VPSRQHADPRDPARDLAARRKRQSLLHLVFVARGERIEEVERRRGDLDDHLALGGHGLRHIGDDDRLRPVERLAMRGAHVTTPISVPRLMRENADHATKMR
jgi:hypothetical protein